ncbi:hypothetical protein ACFC09_36335 [Streptomyces sp. NPDC056161]|uniref:hypothetical protein n=1 Tax=Streptomyces sp. NPDC056161 TaxID=3345732 RepID=UPI0035DA5A44
MSYSLTFFIGEKTHIRGVASVDPALYVEPDGHHAPGYITFQLDWKLSIDEQLEVADRFAASVAAWRDELAARVEQERTAVNELADARAEIARLKAEQTGGAR